MTDSDYRLSDEQRRHLAGLLDCIIPPSTKYDLPGAGELGVGAFIEAELLRNPQLRLVVEPGLALFAAQSREPDSGTAMQRLQADAPALIPTLLFHAYVAYYQNPRITQVLGLGGRPPHPGGYPMAASDLSILDPVRRRGKLYRDAGSATPEGK